jgi:hypothetical protein
MTSNKHLSPIQLARNAAVVALLTLAACRGCGSPSRSGTIWNCYEYAGNCSCAGRIEPTPEFRENLCKRDYECCVYKSEGNEEHYTVDCNCWNPSQGGPTCESKLPKETTVLWSRVPRCI